MGIARAGSPGLGNRDWRQALSRYCKPDPATSTRELVVTAVMFAALWTASLLAFSTSYWLSLAIAVPAAGSLVRLFMIQHDCGHSAFTGWRVVDDWVGRCLGILTLTPYDVWRHSHAVHHATNGNLARRGTGDITTLTVDEYLARPFWQRVRYRIYRHPVTLFGIGPAVLFLIQHRLPLGLMRSGARYWISAMGTNGAILLVGAGMVWAIGAKPFFMIHLPIVLMAASIGVWLFYVQHQFEDTYWADASTWKHEDAALLGSSHYRLPGILDWFTAHIGMHHVHHLSSRIPHYRLPEVMRDFPELSEGPGLTLAQSLACVRLSLWDEQQRRLISFRDLKNIDRRKAPVGQSAVA